MNKKQQTYYLNMVTPNLVNVCIDSNEEGELTGRIYDGYHKEPSRFVNLIQLLHRMEDLYDKLDFPQASTKSRYFIAPSEVASEEMENIAEPEWIFEQRGKKASFAIWVRMRQNATWQGDIVWLEKDEIYSFVSVLDLIKIMDNILD